MSIAFSRGIFRCAVLSASLTLALVSCSRSGREEEAPLPGVIVSPVVKDDIVLSSEVVGQIVAYDDVNLRARVEGFLTQRNFREGQFVKKGVLLFEIEKRQYKAEVDAAKASLAMQNAALKNALLQYDRKKTLYDKNAVSKSEYDQATYEKLSCEGKVLKAKAELEQALLDLSYTDVKAPFDGRVGIARYSVGNLVGPSSETLANIVKIEPIKVQFNINESEIVSSIQDQMKDKQASITKSIIVKLILPNGTMYGRDGRVEFWDNKINPTTGTILIRAVFPNPDALLIPGGYVKVVLQKDSKEEALLIPRCAVQEDQSGHFVLVVNDKDTVTRKNIKTGQNIGINVVVESGLAEGEKVITQGLQKVRPNTKVKPVVDDAYTEGGPPKQTSAASPASPAQSGNSKPEAPAKTAPEAKGPNK